jgi:hypothetical protein
VKPGKAFYPSYSFCFGLLVSVLTTAASAIPAVILVCIILLAALPLMLHFLWLLLLVQVTQATLETKLAEYVDRIDTDMALEYQVQQGMASGAAKEDIYLMPATARHR